MLLFLIRLLARLLLSLRYRISVTGLDKLQAGQSTLFLPNHPALIDPLIVMALLCGPFRPRPLVLERFWEMPGVGWLLRLVRAIPVPAADEDAGLRKRRRIEAAIAGVADGLKNGDNILLYPSGRLSSWGREHLGGNSAVQHLLETVPATRVVLVRTRGLYGSSFSRAYSPQQSPALPAVLKRGLQTLCGNLLFFAPRRHVSLEFTDAPEEFYKLDKALDINNWLERWYDSDGGEIASLVSYSFWRIKVDELPQPEIEQVDVSDISPEITAKIAARLAQASGVTPDKLTPDIRLGEDLGLDSLALAELLLWVEEEFGISGVELSSLKSMGAVMAAAAGRGGGSSQAEVFEAPQGWTEVSRPEVVYAEADSIPEAFLNCSARMGQHVAMADERSGVLCWDRLRKGAILMALLIRRLPGHHIGVLLPASVGGVLGIISSMLCARVPVMINWTSGRKSIEHAVALAGCEKILTSRAFLDALEADLEFLTDKFVFLEDLRKSAGICTKLHTAWLASRSSRTILRFFKNASRALDEVAVIIFTSGSEAAPKGVPLTHRNILSNLRAGMQILKFKPEDALLGFLPPFHSFGLTVSTILPLISGLKVAYFPNPTESRKIAARVTGWQASVMAGTPTFLRSILAQGSKDSLQSLRILVSGAERAPAELFDLAASLGPQISVLEGYGISECAPIVTVNHPGQKRLGVGRPLAGVELLIVDHETHAPLGSGERGLILIRGENVFPGYIGGSPDPFIEVAGQRWYNSGDLGTIEEGRLVISGRLKRFIKIAGEMISLPAIEEVLSSKWPAGEDGPLLAIVSVDGADPGRPLIVLAASIEISLENANDLLRAAGLPNIARISKVVRLPAIPLLGTGKTDIQSLNRMVLGE
jgi:acyl carrier protein